VVTEELLRHPVVEIGHRHPLPGGIPSVPGTKGMNMRMKSCGFAKVCTTETMPGLKPSSSKAAALMSSRIVW
jgi:hypothetical protein